MLTGKRFTLSKSTMALDAFSKHKWVTVPAGAIITVVSGPAGQGDRMIDVRWEARPLAMFGSDLMADGIEIQEEARGAVAS